MKKKILALILALACVGMMLCACGETAEPAETHEFTEATCTEPATCTKCGETQGEALGHDWVEATCENPKTCSRCGATEGEALGHNWVEADCENPKTCSNCGATEGEALGHEWTIATVDAAKTCTVCGATDGEPISVTTLDTSWDEVASAGMSRLGVSPDGEYRFLAALSNGGNFDLVTYDLDHNEISRNTVSASQGWCYSTWDTCFMFGVGSGTYNINIYDYDGNVLANLNVSARGGFPYMTAPDENNNVLFYDSRAIIPLVCLNLDTLEEVSYEEYSGFLAWGFFGKYDTTVWSWYEPVPNMDMFYVKTADESQKGFVDADGNVLALYADASCFSNDGYALVSNDGENYFLIDKDFNILSAEGFITGSDAGCCAEYQAFYVTGADGTVVYYEIK